ncbi:MAG TPA: CHAD domain-containing protein [Vicinamibacterales bacterium]|nr:CHAD domain-containing protein [Vicinamibacterales bacterium]
MARRTPIETLLAPRVVALTTVLPAAVAGEPEAVHRARVASRRLREVLPVFVAADTRRSRDVRAAVRRVTRALGSVRELDVALDLFAAVVAAHGLSPAAQTSARRALHAARSVAARQARTELTRERQARLHALLDRVTVAAAAADEPAVIAALHARLLRAVGRLRKAIDRVSTVYVPGRLHDVRIAAKRLRYALEAVGAACGAGLTAPQVRQLRGIQDLLGRAHDLHVLGESLQAVERRVVTRSRATARDLAVFVRALDGECRALHAAFMGRREALRALAVAVAATPVAAVGARA